MPAVRGRSASAAARAAALLAAGAVGGWLANDALRPPPVRAPAPEQNAAPASAGPESVPSESPAEGPADDALLSFWSTTAFGLATRTRDLEDLIAELREADEDPRESLRRAIDGSTDQELATIVSAVTRIDADELLGSEDLRPFANRLAEVALEGLYEPSAAPPPEAAVLFTAASGDFDPALAAEAEFPADQGRILARIDLPDYDGEAILVRWLHRDAGRIHSLQSLRYRRDGAPMWSYQESDWEPGEYQVDVYSQDARMVPLARGRYTIF